MVAKVNRWTVGGKEFDTKAEAMAHERDLDLATDIAKAGAAVDTPINGRVALFIVEALRKKYRVTVIRTEAKEVNAPN